MRPIYNWPKAGWIIAFSFMMGCATKDQQSPPHQADLVNLEVPTTLSSHLPFLFTTAEDEVVLSWSEQHPERNQIFFSELQNGVWSNPQAIVSGQNWFVNWADFPSVVAQGDRMIAHFLPKNGDGTFAYQVALVTSKNRGMHWEIPYIVHDDRSEKEHGFATILPYENEFVMVWLDGRNTEPEAHGHGGGAMSLRGAILDANGQKKMESGLDDRICDCCQTGGAITQKGPVFVYRDRSQEEIRDISIVRLVKGQWTDPQPVASDNWKISGCPVNGPKAAALNDQLVVSWFTAADDQPKVKLSWSTDNGISFEQPLVISGERPIGRVDVALMDEDLAVVSWMEQTDSGAELRVRSAKRSGKLGQVLVITSMSGERASGFPQMTRHNNRLVFAWTHVEGEEKKVVSGLLSLSSLP